MAPGRCRIRPLFARQGVNPCEEEEEARRKRRRRRRKMRKVA
jgi:hypothetical protein